MKNKITKNSIEQKTFEHYNSGFNCAEAILKAFMDIFDKESDSGVARFASGFGGGIGGSNCEMCGALTGGIIVIGWLFGRKNPDDDKKKVYLLSDKLRTIFLKKFGSTNCKAILDLLGEQENKIKCKKLTSDIAGLLYEIIQEELDK